VIMKVQDSSNDVTEQIHALESIEEEIEGKSFNQKIW